MNPSLGDDPRPNRPDQAVDLRHCVACVEAYPDSFGIRRHCRWHDAAHHEAITPGNFSQLHLGLVILRGATHWQYVASAFGCADSTENIGDFGHSRGTHSSRETAVALSGCVSGGPVEVSIATLRHTVGVHTLRS